MKKGPAAGDAGQNWEKMLRACLARNQAARRSEKDGEPCLLVPTRRPRWLVPPLTLLVHPPSHGTIILDALGLQIWEDCDGARTVEQVIERFAKANALTFHEARVAVTQYTRVLIQKGALAVVV